MRIYLVFCILLVQSLMAVPLEYNNSTWYSGLDPYLVGKRENFMIQGVKVDAIRDANGFTGAFTAVLKFNYGGRRRQLAIFRQLLLTISILVEWFRHCMRRICSSRRTG